MFKFGKWFGCLVLTWAFTISVGQARAQGIPVNFTNNQAKPIQLNFTLLNHAAGPITWGAGCEQASTAAFSSYATIKPGTTCSATVDPSAGSSRFCATFGGAPVDCMNGQNLHLTLIETNFEASTNPGCFGKGACVWYDISVIPSNCTDPLWKANRCRGTGGASYNLPVTLACQGNPEMPVYICKGPPGTKYGSEKYPSNCGNPDAKCATGSPGCRQGVSAYFYPMFDPPENTYQPNAVCLNGTFTATFPPGS